MSYTITSACTGCTACVRVCPVDAIHGERKELHQIDPLKCIDCGACGRVCPSAAVLDEKGALSPMVKRSLWLQPLFIQERCVSCGICLEVCPTSVLDYAARVDGRVHLLPRLADARNCIGCSFCEATCPVEAIRMTAPSLRGEA